MQRRYEILDGLRGLAAIFVVIRHTTPLWGFECYRSYLSVDLFFILSGFVIAHAYSEKLKTISLKEFITIRLKRLYPVYLLSLPLGWLVVIVAAHHKHNNTSEAILSIFPALLFMPSYIAGTPGMFPLNPIRWTLFYELVVNFICAKIFAKKYVPVWPIMVLWVPLTAISLANNGLDIGFLWGWLHILGGFTRAFFGIFMGLLIYRLPERPSISAWFAFPIFLTVLAIPKTGMDGVLDAVFVGIVLPLCVLIGSRSVSFGKEALIKLGATSYPNYVLHYPLGAIGIALLGDKYAPFSGIAFLAALVGLSLAIERFYDIPVRKWFSRAQRQHESPSHLKAPASIPYLD